MAKRTAEEGWASAHVASLIEDGIQARIDSIGKSAEFPVSVEECLPDDAAFVVRFEGTEDDHSYFLVKIREVERV